MINFPATPTAGQTFQDTNTGIWYKWHDCGGGKGAWEQDRSQLTYYDPVPIGTVAAFLLGTAPAGWLLCDGSTFVQANYPELFAVLTNNRLPDLRGQFLRGRVTGQNLGGQIDWTTGMPKTRFTATAANAGGHNHDLGELNQWHLAYGDNGAHAPASANGSSYIWHTGTAGDHTHAITVAGGDTETAPKHVLVDYYIKASHAKVVLPVAGFQAQATALADGDIWMYESASGVFKNVSGASLANGMTVGATAPAAPVDGQMWFRTNTTEPGLLVWANGKWSFSTGANTFNNGVKVDIPGYFDADPSDTTAPVDVIGLAARYNGNKIELFAKKGNAWDPIAPIAGDPANAGKIVSANASGNPIWVPAPSTFERHEDAGYSNSEHVIQLAKPCTQWIKMWGIAQTGPNFTATPRVSFGGTYHDLSATTDNAHGHALAMYKSDGWDIHGDVVFTSNKGGLCLLGVSNYDVHGNHPLHFHLEATRLGGTYWLFRIHSTYLSGNSTPMTFDSGYQVAKNADITHMGIKIYDSAGTTGSGGICSINYEYV